MTADDVQRVSSGTAWEPIVGYSRAVAAGPYVEVAGTTAREAGDSAYEQTKAAIAKIAEALAHVGLGLDSVVRTRLYVTDISRWQEYGRAHGEAFGVILPATSMVEVNALIEPSMLVEIEATAYRGGK